MCWANIAFGTYETTLLATTNCLSYFPFAAMRLGGSGTPPKAGNLTRIPAPGRHLGAVVCLQGPYLP